LTDLPDDGSGSLDPGCLTSEDEERETWTAESLRVSINEGFGFRGLRPDERLRRYTRFKGYTIVISDVNRGWLSASVRKNLGRQKYGGTSSNVVISRLKVSSPT
jgi:hypothetical protein